MQTQSHLTSKENNDYYCGYMRYIGEHVEVTEEVKQLEKTFERRGLFMLKPEFIELTPNTSECTVWVWKNMN